MKIIRSRVKSLFVGPEMRKKNRFRVAIFGSARIQEADQEYQHVYELAKSIGQAGMDVVTGGGPGMMQAANQGHNAGDVKGIAESIGLIIKLPWENSGNPFLEFYKKFDHFSNRLDTFLKLTDAIIITKGGIGTLLELYYMWQHLQVKHVEYKPIILLGEMWEALIAWMKKHPLQSGMISPEDFDFIYIVKNQDEAMKLVEKFQQQKQLEGKMSKLSSADVQKLLATKAVKKVETVVKIKSVPTKAPKKITITTVQAKSMAVRAVKKSAVKKAVKKVAKKMDKPKIVVAKKALVSKKVVAKKVPVKKVVSKKKK